MLFPETVLCGKIVAKRIRTRLAAAIFCAVLLPLFAVSALASPPEALDGVWKIDIEESIKVNEKWRQTFESYGVEAREAWRESLAAKVLALDMKARVIKERTSQGRERFYKVTEVHNWGAGLRMTVVPENSAPYFMDVVLQGRDAMRIVIDENEPIIMMRIAKEGW